jgi:hypothetical protein
VNFIAFPTRFNSTCRIRVLSPSTTAGTFGSTRQISSNPASAARSANNSTLAPTHPRISTGTRSTSSRRLSIREKSRMSLMISSSDSPAVRTVSRYSRCSASTSVSSSSAVSPITAFIGVRISWLMLARNSPLACAAPSAASFASRNPRLASCSSRELRSIDRSTIFRSTSACS